MTKVEVHEFGTYWSAWRVFDREALAAAPTERGVYQVKVGETGEIVYVGMAGDRHGQGLRGRLNAYFSGKAIASGFGEAIFDRALASSAFLRARLSEIERGAPLPAKAWGRMALSDAETFEGGKLFVRWTPPENGVHPCDNPRALEAALESRARADGIKLWNKDTGGRSRSA